jgi:hypothetical protein
MSAPYGARRWPARGRARDISDRRDGNGDPSRSRAHASQPDHCGFATSRTAPRRAEIRRRHVLHVNIARIWLVTTPAGASRSTIPRTSSQADRDTARESSIAAGRLRRTSAICACDRHRRLPAQMRRRSGRGLESGAIERDRRARGFALRVSARTFFSSPRMSSSPS